MSEPVRLPVLPLDDEVVLPGMVVPLDLSDAEVRAAVDAARAAAERPQRRARHPFHQWQCGAAAGPAGRRPRTAAIGTRAAIEQLGRLPNGNRGRRRPRHRPDDDRHRHHRARRGALGGGDQRHRRRLRPAGRRAGDRAEAPADRAACTSAATWQIAEVVEGIDDARPAGGPGRLRAVPESRPEAAGCWRAWT